MAQQGQVNPSSRQYSYARKLLRPTECRAMRVALDTLTGDAESTIRTWWPDLFTAVGKLLRENPWSITCDGDAGLTVVRLTPDVPMVHQPGSTDDANRPALFALLMLSRWRDCKGGELRIGTPARRITLAQGDGILCPTAQVATLTPVVQGELLMLAVTAGAVAVPRPADGG